MTHLYFHLVTNLLECEPDRYLRRLADTFPETDLVVSGCLCDSLRGQYPRLRILRNLEEMEAFARGH
jgi:hypothetical protein